MEEPFLALSCPFLVTINGTFGNSSSHPQSSYFVRLQQRIEHLGGQRVLGKQGWNLTASLMYDRMAERGHTFWFHLVNSEVANTPALLWFNCNTPVSGFVKQRETGKDHHQDGDGDGGGRGGGGGGDPTTATSLRGLELALASSGVDRLRTLATLEDGVCYTVGDDWRFSLGLLKGPKATAICGVMTFEASRTRSPSNLRRFEEWRGKLTAGLGIEIVAAIPDEHLHVTDMFGNGVRNPQYGKDVYVYQWYQLVQRINGQDFLHRLLDELKQEIAKQRQQQQQQLQQQQAQRQQALQQRQQQEMLKQGGRR